MSVFSNPFLPFFESEMSDALEHVNFKDALGNTSAVAEQLGDHTYLRDQIGLNIASIQHFTNDTDLIRSAIGNTEGTLHHFANTTTLTDHLGNPQLVGQQFGDHLLVHDTLGNQVVDIHHVGNSIVATDHLGHTEWTASDS